MPGNGVDHKCTASSTRANAVDAIAVHSGTLRTRATRRHYRVRVSERAHVRRAIERARTERAAQRLGHLDHLTLEAAMLVPLGYDEHRQSAASALDEQQRRRRESNAIWRIDYQQVGAARLPNWKLLLCAALRCLGQQALDLR